MLNKMELKVIESYFIKLGGLFDKYYTYRFDNGFVAIDRNWGSFNETSWFAEFETMTNFLNFKEEVERADTIYRLDNVFRKKTYLSIE